MTATAVATGSAMQRCINPACAREHGLGEVLTGCASCGALLDVAYRWGGGAPRDWSIAEKRAKVGAAGLLDASGVWRFRELMPFYDNEKRIVSIGEGRTLLQQADGLAKDLGLGEGDLFLQYEGYNPSGSFKDNGMTAAFTHAAMVGAKLVACASTGNTSASMAVYALRAGMRAVIFIGEGKIAYGKLSQALDYGARTLQIAGDFDACLARVRHIAEKMPEAGVYLMNSVNPFRLEGQKAVMYRVLEGLSWQAPDWIVVPGGNLGNCSAFGKAFMELRELGLVDRVPRLAVINAAGARTLDRVYNERKVRWEGGRYFGGPGERAVDEEYARMDAANERARTIATAIEINRPVNLAKALRALEVMDGSTKRGGWKDGRAGVVRAVEDGAIRHDKAAVGRFGFGCEPASAASVAGVRQLVREGEIRPGQRVVCILTGHVLKDPDVTVKYHTEAGGPLANPPVRVADDLGAILAAMNEGK